MLIEMLDYPNYRAFKRLVDLLIEKNNQLLKPTTTRLVFLATEHGISREDAFNLIDMSTEDAMHS